MADNDNRNDFDLGRELLKGQAWFRPNEAIQTYAQSIWIYGLVILVSVLLLPFMSLFDDDCGALLVLCPIGGFLVWYLTCRQLNIPFH